MIEVRRWRGTLPRGAAPFGVTACAPGVDDLQEGDALVFAPTSDFGDPAALAALLPTPTGAPLVVLPCGDSSFLARVLGKQVRVSRAVRGSALLLAGYRSIGGATDRGVDLIWAEH